MITFTLEYPFAFRDRRKIKQWIKSVIEEKGCVLGDISYVFCSDERLLEVNREFLQHDYYTDIITFDYVEKNVISGDIIISVDRIKDNARELNVPFTEELHRVIIHGILHLLGYKDHSPEEDRTMRKMEDLCLKSLTL